MKRSLLVAALATLGTTAAFAQSSVTIYGRINTSLERQEANDVKDNVVANNGSRIGFKGLEELGGGLKAGFTLEHRLDSDTGRSTNGDAFWGGAGESSLYLIGDSWGMLKAGHYTSEAYFATSDITDLLNHGTGTSADALYKYLTTDSNKVSYRTPTFGPGWVEVAVLEGAAGSERGYDVASQLTFGSFGVGLGYERGTDEDTQFAGRLSYDGGSFIVTGYAQRYNDEQSDESQNIFRVSGQYNIGAAELHAAFGTRSELETGGVVLDPETKQYTIGANYNLSKRTKVYTYYNRIKPDGIDAITALAVGVRHNF